MLDVCVFPGQGSQFQGMGRELFDRHPAEVEEASDSLGYDLRELCLNDPERKLGQTRYTQPALFTVNTLHYLDRLDRIGKAPDVVAGHSLGEYNALLAAGVFDFATGLRLVAERGRLMSEVSGGGMAAVLGLKPRPLERAIAGKELADAGIDIANYNSYDQIVLAGRREALDQAAPVLERAGARTVLPLNVSAPFHSRYMQLTAKAFRGFLSGVTLRPPQVAVIANCDAMPYRNDLVADTLVRQIASPVRWVECMEYIFRMGPAEFTELGPGTVLTKLIGQIRAQSAFAS
jgi:trans-AT polyketide synthase/acyltransferase/oxidoreductase domain-containing protein